MEQNRKKIRKIFWIALVAGSAVIGVVLAAWDPQPPLKQTVFIIWLLIALVGALTVNLLWRQQLSRKLQQLNLILTQERDPDRYISEINALLADMKSKQLQQIRHINLAAAYCDKHDYAAALEQLEQVDPTKMPGANQSVYWANRALTHFYLHEDDIGCAIMDRQRKQFQKDEPVLDAILAFLYIFELLAHGEKEEAAQRLERARSHWSDPRYEEDFAYLEARCGAEPQACLEAPSAE